MEPSASCTCSPSTRRFPQAILLCLFAGVLATLAALVIARWYCAAGPDRKVLVLVGDSYLANYRLPPGERMEELLQQELGPGWVVHNFAKPGARTLDFDLQLQQALTLSGRVDLVVADLFPHKLMPEPNYSRLNGRGDGLKWLRLWDDRAGLHDSLDVGLRKQMAIQNLGLYLYGFYDGAEYLFNRFIQQPNERAAMTQSPAARRSRIEEYARKMATAWAARNLTPDSLLQSQAASDLSLLTQDARARQLPLVFLLLPHGNTGLVQQFYAPQAQGQVAIARNATLAWMERQQTPWIDLNGALSAEDFDDMWHVKGVESSRKMAIRIAAWVKANQP